MCFIAKATFTLTYSPQRADKYKIHIIKIKTKHQIANYKQNLTPQQQPQNIESKETRRKRALHYLCIRVCRLSRVCVRAYTVVCVCVREYCWLRAAESIIKNKNPK